MTPEYWHEACAALSKRDKVMRSLIKSYPEAQLRTRGDAFQTLARAIVGQQISVKAAQSVWNKTLAAAPSKSGSSSARLSASGRFTISPRLPCAP